MKKRVFLVLALSGCICLTAMAQLSTGVSSSDTIRTGNRARGGDYGLYMGVKTEIFQDLFSEVSLGGTLPLLNFKYFMSDETEIRIGVDISRSARLLNGEWKDADNTTQSRKDKSVETTNLFYPGIAHHFSNKNLLDVYAGAELPFGWSRSRTVIETGSDAYAISSRTSFNVGLGVFVGLQAYVANLPIAIGLEYGIASMFDLRQKTKNKVKIPGQSEVITFTPDDSFGVSQKFDKLSARRGEIGGQLRLTLTYYFNNR